ncbi:hypothetical protein HYFRA_00002264 [Hymenoscyphus fraxineus]|uniref:Secreted protein n=1 Tax=Hymenoscyphus fraxineus TaxID=746836 RepID=A0A9N9PZ71_9HELO|nr:hypothetical protein HYFRA_00002264 [Hymenoscyphus fraxineus]
MQSNNMKLLSMLLCLIGLITLAVAGPPFAEGLTVRDGADDLPYPLVPAQWTVNLDGKNHTFNGTVQSVHAQLNALRPDWRSIVAADTAPLKLKPRNKSGIICCDHTNWHWPYAAVYNILEAYDELDSLGATPCGVQARSCVQIACWGNDGVVLCNDNWYYIQPHARYLSSYILDIRNVCTQHPPGADYFGTMCGQEFDTDNYNIIVKSQTYPGC